MKTTLFNFQEKALQNLRIKLDDAINSYKRTHTPQVISFTAPTGAGKTIIIASLIESVFFGNDSFPEQQDAIFVWISDSPQLNEQSKQKIEFKTDKLVYGQCVTITEDSFDKEMLEDGHVYFLNTQKLGKSSNLVKHSDSRQYTIWETLAYTVKEKGERLYFIIDEAHRGMLEKDAAKATSIMQKFIKGSSNDNLPTMPIVLGMSATSQRFDVLVQGTTSTIHKVVITPDEVRSSGLLKDRIVIVYPEEQHNADVAVLQAATDEWRSKWDHWQQYCKEQHYANVNPVFVIQVLNGSGDRLTDSPLDELLKNIEERTNCKFIKGEVVHTFGQTTSDININGLEIPYEEPSRIAENRKIKVVFFKENLTTGWDCPRAETMLSYKHARDITYIAQLLGRMIRTPLQMRIQVDETLNDVHLYLPYFDADTVKKVVDELVNTEGAELPTEITNEATGHSAYTTLTVKPRSENKPITPSHHSSEDVQDVNHVTQDSSLFTSNNMNNSDDVDNTTVSSEDHINNNSDRALSHGSVNTVKVYTNENKSHVKQFKPEEPCTGDLGKVSQSNESGYSNSQNKADDQSFSKIDREAIVKFINDSSLPTYNIRKVKIKNYLTSLYDLSRLLTQSGISSNAHDQVLNDIVNIIRQYCENLRANGKYEALAKNVKLLKLSKQSFDIFGKELVEQSNYDLLVTDADIDRQFYFAENLLGKEGVANYYLRTFNTDDFIDSQIDVILFASDKDCMDKLQSYAERTFKATKDKFRRAITASNDEKIISRYNSIISDGDTVSDLIFRLPETIQVPTDKGGIHYSDHLFVDANSGTATIKLNGWEQGVIAEEQRKATFVCWLRNWVKRAWSLCIPYQTNNESKGFYPDFLIISKDKYGHQIDILEPHGEGFADNFAKAQALAKYAQNALRVCSSIGRIQLIRELADKNGSKRFKRLDMTDSLVRDRTLQAMNSEDIDRLFTDMGFFDD